LFFEIQPVSGAIVAASKHSLIAIYWTLAVKGKVLLYKLLELSENN